MHRRTRIATAATAVALATALPPAANAVQSPTARVLGAVLQVDGSVTAQVESACRKGNTYELQVAISQEFQSNGAYYEAVAYSPAVAGKCYGRTQRTSLQTTASDRAPFQRTPTSTLGTIHMTVRTADGRSTYHHFETSLALR